MSENTQVIIMVAFINGILYALIQAWKSRRAAKADRDGGGNTPK
jgi:hypothetical protein